MTENKIRKQYGLWNSLITPLRLARGTRISDVAWDDDGSLIWRESRSKRNFLVVQPPDGQAPRDLNRESDVRAGVGYGGGDFTAGGGDIYFVEAKSGRIFRQPTHSGFPKAITPAFGAAASLALSPNKQNLLYVHTDERVDSIAIVKTDGESWPQKLVSGNDFYMQPCWHPGGTSVAWIAWNHPQMPWDGTSLYLGGLEKAGSGFELGQALVVAGGTDIAVFQPQFSPDGRYLAYVADPDGWWQLYLYDLESGEHRVCTGGEAEHGQPAWVQGLRTYDFSPDSQSIYYTRSQDGFMGLWKLDIQSMMKERVRIGSEYTWLLQPAAAPVGEQIALIASGSRVPDRVITTTASGVTRVVCRSDPEDLRSQTYSLPQPIQWPGMDKGEVNGFYYAPQNEAYEGVGKPPLMVLIHGGPTGQRGASFDAQAQFFASRGWGVLQVNYRGSAGYGRAYREMLRGNWGVHDVQDVVSGARYLVDENMVDAQKLVIMGGSAGGFTVLKTLEDYPGIFKAGICLYGVANQFNLVADTHKFEERYSDFLLGTLPEAAEVYRERSPIFFVDKIQDPIAIFQGMDDKVVPQNQSDEIVEALKRNGVPHEYHLYPGEGHGFRKEENIDKFYKVVEKFLQQYVIYA